MSNIENRLAKIEREIEMLKRANQSTVKKENWLDQVIGTFKNDKDFEEIVRLGKEQRNAENAEEDH